ncbi:MAG TPA: hypothetical protein VMU25_03315 [Candidatus Paceibacterota bacterium]|nr:hypothetical protein [Candidatus Paceibacterota bacterium]
MSGVRHKPREPITRAHLEEVLASSKPHPVSVDRFLLNRYKHALADLTEDAFEYFGSLLTNDDPEGFDFFEEAKRRGCTRMCVRSTRLQTLLSFLQMCECRNEYPDNRTIDAWNELARIRANEDDFNLEPFMSHLRLLRVRCG